MKKTRSKSKILVLLLLLLVGISIGYAALTSTLNINGNTNIKKISWDIHFENLVKTKGSEVAEREATIDANRTLIEYTVKLSQPGDFYEFTVDIVNKGSIDAMVSEVLKTGLSIDEQKYIEYTATYSDKTELKEKDELKAGTKKNIKVKVKYRDDLNPDDLPGEDKSISLSFQVTYVQAGDNKIVEDGKNSLVSIIKESAVLDNIASEYVTSSTGINFAKISGGTNGKGLYILSSTKDATHPIYYYRGAVNNNNVKFANFCWKIVRTTETGGIKLLYNGVPDSSGYCNNTGVSSEIGKSKFNLNKSFNAYVGYMYGTANSTSYSEVHNNINDSEIKKIIDAWYSENLLLYTDKLEDTVWCNDRSVYTDTTYTGDGSGTTNTMYGAKYRVQKGSIPSFECSNLNDRFTVSSDNGNGKLTYPVALLTADEVVYAGSVYGVNNSTYYLYTQSSYWTMSPYQTYRVGVGEPNASSFIVMSNGNNTNTTMTATGGVRPSISLKAGVKIVSGDGTSSDPYVIG